MPLETRRVNTPVHYLFEIVEIYIYMYTHTHTYIYNMCVIDLMYVL